MLFRSAFEAALRGADEGHDAHGKLGDGGVFSGVLPLDALTLHVRVGQLKKALPCLGGEGFGTFGGSGGAGGAGVALNGDGNEPVGVVMHFLAGVCREQANDDGIGFFLRDGAVALDVDAAIGQGGGRQQRLGCFAARAGARRSVPRQRDV